MKTIKDAAAHSPPGRAEVADRDHQWHDLQAHVHAAVTRDGSLALWWLALAFSFGTVHRHVPKVRKPGPLAQAQHLDEQLRESREMALAKVADGAEIRPVTTNSRTDSGRSQLCAARDLPSPRSSSIRIPYRFSFSTTPATRETFFPVC